MGEFQNNESINVCVCLKRLFQIQYKKKLILHIKMHRGLIIIIAPIVNEHIKDLIKNILYYLISRLNDL